MKLLGAKSRVVSAKCWSHPLIEGDTADNGIKAYPLSKKAGFFGKKQVGSPPKWRFCPMAKLGMRQQYALGNVLRRRYMTGTEPFLNSRYNSKQVYVRSTDVNRTLISAYSNIAGMFSGGEAGKDFPNETNWPSGWTPVPVHTIPTDEDHDFLEYLSKYTGMKVDLPIVYLINDVHHIETIYNMSQPKWMTHEVSKRLRNLTSLVNEYAYGIGEPYVPELIRLRGGPMLRSIVDLMNLKKDCLDSSKQRSECNWIKPLKYYAYSAHDTTVAALLSTFGDEMEVIRGGLPKYTASVAIELWTLEGEGPAVRILFHGAFHHNYHTITHLTKGCPIDKEFCPLEVFENRSLQFMPTDMKKECERRERSNRTNQMHKIRKPSDRRMNKEFFSYLVKH
ncbi:histidine acid phosphatase [Teladorsagia circumcincta]|uniref:Histidine acid phosphatase n=1 Tax=Teladorsagia circumcincta TaxID=45464 RepID=A0A2G9U1V7_TELCI|nr:histidine acid phosphatase [Teladorsagia circumcincta]